ncbi:6-hydroxymethylpterin diphosphokinase MptE-like protein [Clostridium perfringens]
MLRFINEKLKSFIFELIALFRVCGLASIDAKKIRCFKDKHKGERCFIIATGPSLRMEDVEKLDKEYTFTMNSMCLALNNTKWRPTYYGIQDFAVYEKLENNLKELNLKNVFVGSNIAKRYNISNKWYIYPLNISYHLFELRFKNKYFVKFSNNAYKAIYDGYTITYSLIQLAVYMGFKEIYLIGADTNYNVNNQHFLEHGVVDPTYNTAKDRMIVAYEKAKEYADKNNIKIYNATRGGMLEVFPRVDIDKLEIRK